MVSTFHISTVTVMFPLFLGHSTLFSGLLPRPSILPLLCSFLLNYSFRSLQTYRCQRLKYALHAGRILKYGINNCQCKISCYYKSFIKPFVTYFRRPSVRCAISRFCGHSIEIYGSRATAVASNTPRNL